MFTASPIYQGCPVRIFSRLWNDESGATAIEYGLIAALISVALITGAGALGTSLNTQFNTLAGKMNAS
jgi:pilus assembly protein Flp/PilA